MKIGIIVGEATPLTWDRWRHVGHVVERLGFASLFRSDHFYNGAQKDAIDVYLSFVATALETTNLRFGTLVTPVTFRPPVIVGRMAQQLDSLSGGRFVLGLGAGWSAEEHRVYGLDFPPTTERFDRLDDALELLVRLWYDTPAIHDGPYYRLAGADSRPHPPRGRPRILIGGNGPTRTLRAVARHAHEWNAVMQPPDRFRESVATLERHCADVGRDPAEIRRSMMIFAVLGEGPVRDIAAQRAIEMLAPGSGLASDDLRTSDLGHRIFSGSTPELVDYLGELAALGVEEVVFEHFATDHDDIPEWIAAELEPQVRGL